jgi:hypothetical protein
MAQVYRIKNPVPSMGDAEAQRLVDNFSLEFEAGYDNGLDPQAQMVRITADALKKVKPNSTLAKHMCDMLDIMMQGQRWVDLLVWW